MTLWHFFWLSSVQSVADQTVFNLRTGYNFSDILLTTPELTMAFIQKATVNNKHLSSRFGFNDWSFVHVSRKKHDKATICRIFRFPSSWRYYEGRMKSSNRIIDCTNFPRELCQLCTNQKWNNLCQSASVSAVYSGPFVELSMSRGTFSTVHLWMDLQIKAESHDLDFSHRFIFNPNQWSAEQKQQNICLCTNIQNVRMCSTPIASHTVSAFLCLCLSICHSGVKCVRLPQPNRLYSFLSGWQTTSGQSAPDTGRTSSPFRIKISPISTRNDCNFSLSLQVVNVTCEEKMNIR